MTWGLPACDTDYTINAGVDSIPIKTQCQWPAPRNEELQNRKPRGEPITCCKEDQITAEAAIRITCPLGLVSNPSLKWNERGPAMGKGQIA